MKYNLFNILFLLSVYPLHMSARFDDIFRKNTIIGHPQTGLFFNYLGLYAPSETIIHNSAIFPMTAAACYFLPISAAETIPSCNITSKRYKRFIPGIVSVGSGAWSLSVSKSNQLKLENLQQQMEVLKKALLKYSETIQVDGARLANLDSNQISLTEELRMTQKTFSAMLSTLNSHSRVRNTLEIAMERLYNHFQHSSLYSAINQIFQNDLTLNFLSPEDLNKVVRDVLRQVNVTFHTGYGSVPLLRIITEFLVRQQVDFIPRSRYTTHNSEEIGRLVITNFFAVPTQNQKPFHLYELLAAPFVYNKEIIQLTHIPRYWAINLVDNTTMEWYDSKGFECDLRSMLYCRDTPPIQKLSQKTCLGQIIGRHPLSTCLTTATSSSVSFLRQLGDNLWISSSSEPLHCIRTSKSDNANISEQTFNINEHVNLPHVAVINVTPGHVITCSEFVLTGRPIISNVSLILIFRNNTVFTSNFSIVNVHDHMKENTAWFDRNSFKLGSDSITPYMDTSTRDNALWTSHSICLGILLISILGCVFLGVSSSMIYYIFQRRQQDSLQHPSSSISF